MACLGSFRPFAAVSMNFRCREYGVNFAKVTIWALLTLVHRAAFLTLGLTANFRCKLSESPLLVYRATQSMHVFEVAREGR